MSRSSISNRTWALVIVGAWTLYGLMFGIQSYVSNSLFGRPIPLWMPLGIWLCCSYSWALLTPGVIRLTERFPMEPGRYAISSFIHVVAGIVFSSIQLLIYILAEKYLVGTTFDVSFG